MLRPDGFNNKKAKAANWPPGRADEAGNVRREDLTPWRLGLYRRVLCMRADAWILVVEWRHLDVQGQTCDRCRDTGSALREAIEALSADFARSGVLIEYRETRLDPFDIAASNGILVDGTPIERLLPDASVTHTCCASCGELVGAATDCRALKLGGALYETIPAELIRMALRAALANREGNT